MGNENLYKNIFKNTQDAILIADDDGNYIDANPAAAKLFGYTIEELCKLNVGDITPEQNIEESMKLWKEFIASDTMEGEFQIRRKDGKLVTTYFRAAANVTDHRHVSVMRDITNLKLAEAALKKSNDHLTSILESISDGFFVLNNNMIITYFNKEAEKILNRKREDVNGKHIFEEAFPEAKDSIFEKNYTKALNERITLTFEVDFGIAPYQNWFSVRVYPSETGISVYFQAITEQKKAELLLRNEESEKTQILQKMLNAFVLFESVFDDNGDFISYRFININKAYEKITGVKNEEVKGKTVHEVWPETEQEWIKRYGEVAVSGVPQTFELYHKPTDKIYFCQVYRPFDTSEKFCVIFEDRSEQKKAEENLRESEAFSKSLINFMSDGFSILDVNGIHIDVNPAFCKMTGFSREEIIGTGPPHPYWPAEEYKHIQEALSKTSQGILHSSELIFKKKNGERFPVIVSPSQLKDREGNVINNFATIKDITDRKKAEKALKESEEQLSSLYNSMTEGVCLHEIVYDESGKAVNYRILDANPIFEEILQIDRSKIKGKLATETYEVDKAPYLETYASVIKTNEPIRFESYFPPMKKYFSTAAFSLGKNKFATVFEDITERKNNEAELEEYRNHLERLIEDRTSELESANRELREFTYSVSHDLRAPLRSIMGFSEIISKRHRTSLNEEGIRYFDFIMEASNNMSRLIEDLLQYSRLGKKENEMVDMKSIIDNVLLNLEKEITELDAEIILPNKFPVVFSNRTLIEQIVFNLSNNSIKYHSKGERPKLEIAIEESPKKILITVKDNGIGIPHEYHEKIFNIFQRLHSDAEYPGTGIGLAIVKKSVTVLNGKVWLESDSGKGSTFFVELPTSTEN